VFALTGVPPGPWIIRFDGGPEQSANAWIELGPGQDCFDVRAVVGPAGALSGSVVDEQGSPLVGAPIIVLAADDDPDTPAYQALTDERGGFEILGVRAGVYVVRAGVDDEERGQFPYRPQFYPTARDRESAKTIEVRGAAVRIGPIVMRGPLPTVAIAVEIVCIDGTRPTHAYARAERADGEHEYTTPVDARMHRIVRVFPGQHYVLGGAVRGRQQALDGRLQVAWMATTKTQVDPARSSGVHQLLAHVRECDAPGGPMIDAR
jgi:hypothetical protein